MKMTKLYNVKNAKAFNELVQFMVGKGYKLAITNVKDWGTYKDKTTIVKFTNGVIRITNLDYVTDSGLLNKVCVVG